MRLLTITSDGKTLDLETGIVIRHDANLRVAYIGITYSNPSEMEYQYKLDDAEHWTNTKDRSLEFSALSWGEHVLRVRAHKYNSTWSMPVEVQFSIIPPFYGTWWFRFFLLIILSSLVYGVVRFLLRRRYHKQLAIMEQEQLVLEERNRISTDLHDDLGAELSNIVILSRIARSKMKNKQDATEPVLKIDTAANDIINKMSGIIWSLNPSNDYLDNLMDYLRKYSQDFLELHNLEGEVVMSGAPRHRVVKGMLRRNVFLILKEALQNVYKHSGAGRVDIRILLEEGKMILSVVDNGGGFNREEKKGFGLGLNSMKRRATEVGGTLTIDSTKGKGTSVILNFPV
jgi:signal transduction histidine kinase